MKNILWALVMKIRLWWYLRTHYIDDLEQQLLRVGSRVVSGHGVKVYHLPKGGRIIIGDETVEIIPADFKA